MGRSTTGGECNALPIGLRPERVMHALWGLADQELRFERKGGTSLSKDYGLIHRFSKDIDILIHPPEDVRAFIGTKEYREHKNDSIRGRGRDFGFHAAFDILRPEREGEYARTAGLYYRGQPSLSDIVDRIEPFPDDL